jgi:hypothetical protein
MTLVRKPVYSDAYQEIGQVIEGTLNTVAFSTTTSDLPVTNTLITLPAGKWQITYDICVDVTTTTVSGNQPFISLALADSSRLLQIRTPAAATNYSSANLRADYTVILTSSTSYKIVAKNTSAAAATVVQSAAGIYESRFFAVRIGHS